jgi:hypothetical protein
LHSPFGSFKRGVLAVHVLERTAGVKVGRSIVLMIVWSFSGRAESYNTASAT